MKFLNKNNQNIYQKGFTLIELLVVIAIISLLSSIVMASLNSARQKAKDAVRLSDINQVKTAIEMYINDNGKAPYIKGPNGDGVISDFDNADWSQLEKDLSPYIKQLPKDPCGSACYSKISKSSSNGGNSYFAYSYSNPTPDSSTYIVEAQNLESKNDFVSSSGTFFVTGSN